MGIYTSTVNGHQHVFPSIDQFTGYVVAVSTSVKTAESVNAHFIHAVACIFYTPITILSDSELKFHKPLFKNVARILVGKCKFSSLFYPQGNSRIENVHNFLKTCSRKYIRESFQGLAVANCNYKHTHST